MHWQLLNLELVRSSVDRAIQIIPIRKTSMVSGFIKVLSNLISSFEISIRKVAIKK
jgi:hypothetical protein